jgi:phospholipase C
MVRFKSLLALALLILSAGVLAFLNSCGGGGSSASTAPPPPPQKVQHVIVIYQENRSTDNLFQDPNLIAAGADIKNKGINSSGTVIPLTPTDLHNDASPYTAYDLYHGHLAFTQMYDNGKMDGADKIELLFCYTNCPPPSTNPQFKYVDPSLVGPYFQLAETYTFGDRMFQTNQGPSFPSHQYIISGTSIPAVGSTSFVAENPQGSPGATKDTGCTTPPQNFVYLIDPQGNENQTIYPCFEHPTLTDELEAKSLSWKYYTASAGSIWTAPNAIKHMCGPNSTNTSCTGSDWTNNVVLQNTQILSDIAAGNLAAVSWVIPSGQQSDHALATDGSGPSWVASVVNAVGQSQYWSNTVIFITWDDWGGWYDHVAPSIKDSYEYGFRVPLIVVSPYAKKKYVSHVTHHFGSILKYIEETFSLPSLGYADSYPETDDLSDCFDYTQTPGPFQTVKSQLGAKYFMENKEAPSDPDDD